MGDRFVFENGSILEYSTVKIPKSLLTGFSEEIKVKNELNQKKGSGSYSLYCITVLKIPFEQFQNRNCMKK